MEITFQTDCQNIDWHKVKELLKVVGMANFSPEKHKLAFQNSEYKVFAFFKNELVGFGRAISDNAYQAAIYDLAISPEFQGQGLGKRILAKILKALPGCNFILYSSPGKEDFYCKQGFKKMKTGMAIFLNSAAASERGFTE